MLCQQEELDETSPASGLPPTKGSDPTDRVTHPGATVPPTRPLTFNTPVFINVAYDARGGGGGGAGGGEPSAEFFSDTIGADLSQDSQMSVSSLSLSQEQLSLSQGSHQDLRDVPADAAKLKRKSSKKTKKKKVKSSSKTRDGSPSQTTAPGISSSPQPSNSISSERSQSERDQTKLERTNSSNRVSKGEKSESRKHRTPSRRPEPEGGNSQAPTFSADEYERIINSNEPLFSDLEVSGDEANNNNSSQQPQRPARCSRMAGRVAAAAGQGMTAGIFIPCTQLGINSNTMIKFAIIGTELQNIFQVSHRVSSLALL